MPSLMSETRKEHNFRLAIRSLTVLLAMLAIVMLIVPAAQAYDNQELAFLNLINNYRQQNGLPPLALSTSLTNAAEGHSYDMAVHNYFSHTGSDGSSPWDRIRAAGYTYNTYLGENIAAGFDTAQSVFDAWRNSPGHNANMLNANFRAIGIGRYYSAGSYYGWYWTTDFGGVIEDNTPPTVSIPAPSGGDKVSGKVVFSANAWDNVAVMRVDLYIDGALVASCANPPYNYYWDTSNYANGSQHTLSAVAHDAAGLQSQASLTVTVDNFTPTKRYYFTWYDQQTPGLIDWVLMANPSVGQGSARASVLVGATTFADRDINVGAPAETPMFPGVMGGPVTIQSTQPLVASQRVLYKNSFNEIAAVTDTALATTYYFTWYDSDRNSGMMGDWILIANMGSSSANVQVYIGGLLKGTYSIGPGDRVTPWYPNTTDGPVRVVSTNGQPLIVSQRVIYQDSFSEVVGVPEGSLASEYYFPWYDCTPQSNMVGNWILIGNEDTGDAAVDVYIAGQKKGSYIVPSGGRITPIYRGVMGGPVKVTSTNGKKLIVSQRVLYMNSFEEVQGLTAADASTDLWFTWYDSQRAHGMNGNWILITNNGASDAAVDVYIGGSLKQHVTVPAGGNLPLIYYETMGGPVRVVSTNGQPLLVTQRVIYKNSFNEIAGMKFP